jgi:hypothetical protein
VRIGTTIQAATPLYPRGPRSGPGYAVPIHQHLIDPIRATGKHVPTSRLCGYTKRLGCAGAPRPPASGSVLSLQILVDMSPSLTPEKSAAVLIQVPSPQTRPSPNPQWLGFLINPTIRFTWGGDFGASQQFACATTCRLVRPPDGSDSALASPARTFTSRLPPEQSPASGAGYGYRGNWIISTGRTLTGWINS